MTKCHVFLRGRIQPIRKTKTNKMKKPGLYGSSEPQDDKKQVILSLKGVRIPPIRKTKTNKMKKPGLYGSNEPQDDKKQVILSPQGVRIQPIRK